ncbi:hypothetical protein KIL84_007649 [Mauremys mutica]|uniref:Uncharacterized protein n=1 Tax=Mauremys mutica TaxID=74926 RepID=A0A9D3X377_9SAUR|nr:hypothetical protein KIL84_007649 [Mauremys mutica]
MKHFCMLSVRLEIVPSAVTDQDALMTEQADILDQQSQTYNLQSIYNPAGIPPTLPPLCPSFLDLPGVDLGSDFLKRFYFLYFKVDCHRVTFMYILVGWVEGGVNALSVITKAPL